MMVVFHVQLNNESVEWIETDDADLDFQQSHHETPAAIPIIENIPEWTAKNSVEA